MVRAIQPSQANPCMVLHKKASKRKGKNNNYKLREKYQQIFPPQLPGNQRDRIDHQAGGNKKRNGTYKASRNS